MMTQAPVNRDKREKVVAGKQNLFVPGEAVSDRHAFDRDFAGAAWAVCAVVALAAVRKVLKPR